MGQEAFADTVLQIRDFPGLVTQADPGDVQPGAAKDQVNVESSQPGTLRSRGGLRRVLFEES